MSDDDNPPGLRERKRLATRRAIQIATITLVRDKGYDAVTVEMISRRADVSPRTFFNYFTSKDEALIGDPPEMPTGESVERFVNRGADGRLLDDVVELLDEATGATITDRELVLKRRQVIRSHPELFARRVASMHGFEAQLVEVLGRRLAADDPDLAADEERLGREARLAALVTMAALRHGWAEWVEQKHPDGHHEDIETSLRENLEASFSSLGRLLSREAPEIR
ncbi:putative HTH-type transcriptional regulator [Frondihabitans sp. 762G35]|uniref:TetR/AcrR family transcriptional regulator n=1 Tax=Frondihabitans sp. 762G35 TaxID=1446794 RepID=UPI000D222270|nr:TetR/AcrR family transcriptional regulator [Frondihabitans sp. 762G35]ARC57510.1 putative HTH-type transcriptional regulator [Frondihabitans sp. 762G35]